MNKEYFFCLMTSILYSFDFHCIYVEINILLFTGFQISFLDSISILLQQLYSFRLQYLSWDLSFALSSIKLFPLLNLSYISSGEQVLELFYLYSITASRTTTAIVQHTDKHMIRHTHMYI